MLDLQLFTIGKIIAAHGVKGQIKLKSKAGLSLELQKGTWLFLIIQKKPVPFLCIEDTAIEDTLGILHLEGINGPEKVREFIGIDVAIEIELLGQDITSEDKEFDSELIGYLVFDGNQAIGVVEDMYDNAGQTLLAVKSVDNTHLIPLVEEFILEIKKEPKHIMLELPQGLL